MKKKKNHSKITQPNQQQKQSSRFKKSITLLEKLIRAFNFAFFLVSIGIWLYLTVDSLLTQPFEWALLWNAFNNMYAQFSFKVGCIILIIFNGLQTIRNWIFDYYDILEYAEHIGTL
ncbi:hypothetical protein IT411_00200, partial [Candidatus Peregrinibacteria bacterium]|nr:hypothetical protein [Candidatus Peregrinibacteria bacterium]